MDGGLNLTRLGGDGLGGGVSVLYGECGAHVGGSNTRTANARSVDRAEWFHVGPLAASHHVTAGAGPKVGSKTASFASWLPRGGPDMHCRARGPGPWRHASGASSN
ncbi:hypothetical protein AAC387_Pa06g0664 [Persea americana]